MGGVLTMAKAVLISIRPKWVEKIANEWKTIEVRKTKPYLDTPFKCYIYCTNTRPFLVWGDSFYTKMECDGRTIKRPPQSWCYVEELR